MLIFLSFCLGLSSAAAHGLATGLAAVGGMVETDDQVFILPFSNFLYFWSISNQISEDFKLFISINFH